ncbi:YcjF family protein [Blastochloris sulfoviridis]|uniref:TIGR01620 family protein n=1 Tax=Blastochloris sulfoviridis TaxID=50712 RepID=A0A5M6I3J6_9HYPH|nr:TIGR01620 family protein [Blastochloris sulfoviridis]KAA5602776.1 TIGR01620 family protein [Blastochloris sulfoviridis]
MTEPPRRRPVVFRLDDPTVVVSDPSAPVPARPQPAPRAPEQRAPEPRASEQRPSEAAGAEPVAATGQAAARPAPAKPAPKPAAAKVPEPPPTRIDVEPRPAPAPRSRPQTTTIVTTPAPAKPKSRLGTLAWSAVGGLISIYVSLQIWQLIEEAFARSALLGSLASLLALIVAVAALVVGLRELVGLLRLENMAKVRSEAEQASATDDRARAETVVKNLLSFAAENPRLVRARTDLAEHLEAIIDGRDLIHLAERELMGPLDAEARRMVAETAARISVVTAVSPNALVDILFVAASAVSLVRRLGLLYGGRPGALGLIKIGRQTLSLLAVTGGLAAGDAVLQQMVGHGLAAKLSAKLGQGLLNGMLTVRLGVAAIHAIRPLPFSALPKPTVRELAADLMRRTKTDDATAEDRN